MHVSCAKTAVDRLIGSLNKRVLIDDNGVWVAEGDDELQELQRYCTVLKEDKSKRPSHRPYDTIVVQRATSSFIPRSQRDAPATPDRSPSPSVEVVA